MTEGQAASKLVGALQLVGFAATKIVASAEQVSGLPDIIACDPHGRFVAIEVKLLKKATHKFRYTKKQLLRLKEYAKLGAVSVGVVVIPGTGGHRDTILVDSNRDAHHEHTYESYTTFCTGLTNHSTLRAMKRPACSRKTGLAA